uniref:Lipoxygenase domain-containing protein n=1 Tax=Eptatretus burgeri TaxID=7764 RepID=A0A8C4N5P1_EPTBU
MLIEVCRSMAQVPADMLGLRGQDHSLHELIAEQRLYVVDYKALKDIPLHEDKVFYAPIVLLYRELLPYGCSRLMPLGIQLTRNPGRNEVYTPHSPPNRYLFAKIHVGCADNQLHQFNTHLSLTHLLGEAFCVGVHNNLSGHPLGTLLLPHTLDTIGINYIARHSLISQVHPLTDATFSVGTVGGLTLVVDHFRAYRFLEWSFPAELARRGFDERRTDGIADFLYRDDGFLLWRALEAYTCKYVNRLYKTDADVAEDYGIH